MPLTAAVGEPLPHLALRLDPFTSLDPVPQLRYGSSQLSPESLLPEVMTSALWHAVAIRLTRHNRLHRRRRTEVPLLRRTTRARVSYASEERIRREGRR